VEDQAAGPDRPPEVPLPNPTLPGAEPSTPTLEASVPTDDLGSRF